MIFIILYIYIYRMMVVELLTTIGLLSSYIYIMYIHHLHYLYYLRDLYSLYYRYYLFSILYCIYYLKDIFDYFCDLYYNNIILYLWSVIDIHRTALSERLSTPWLRQWLARWSRAHVTRWVHWAVDFGPCLRPPQGWWNGCHPKMGISYNVRPPR